MTVKTIMHCDEYGTEGSPGVGWYHVSREINVSVHPTGVPSYTYTQEFDFCNIECLRKWSSKERG